MKKIILVTLLGLTVIFSSISYVLTQKIHEGQFAIAEGKKQIAHGEIMLAKGRHRLANGEHQLSEAKKANTFFQNIPLMSIAEKVPIGGDILNMPNAKIAEGGREVDSGKAKLKNGEAKLVEGKVQLQQGIDRLNKAKCIRELCVWGGLISGTLFILLFIFLRRGHV